MQDIVRNAFGEPLAKKIDGFPYAERFCPFCERELTLEKAAHIAEEPMHYKALYLCHNPSCGAYDEDAGKAYARVYYSSQEAFEKLELTRLLYERKSVR